MFVAQAHSFTQQARLAITLAWVAGYTNLVTLLACGHVTSHISGTTSDFGHALAEGRTSVVLYAAFLLCTFFAGAALSGFTTELGRRRGWNSIYVLPMAIEALFLALIALVIALRGPSLDPADPVLHWLTGLASAAMGLQNATITRISSGVVRTTHVTGVLTDLGMESVQLVWWILDRRRLASGEAARRLPVRALVRSLHTHPTGRRLALLASILGSFSFGALLGTLLFDRFPTYVMVLPVLFLTWIVYQDLTVPIADIEPWDAIDGQRLDLPASLALFRLRRGGTKRVHRMPDLLAWCERLPSSARVVVLDLGESAVLDANTALELKATIERLARDGRELVLAGLSGDALDRLRRDGLDALRGDHVASDLELALGLALTLATAPRAAG